MIVWVMFLIKKILIGKMEKSKIPSYDEFLNESNSSVLTVLIKFIETYGNLSSGDYSIKRDRLVVTTDLDLSHKGISRLPDDFGKLVIHGSLNLSNNKLKKLPKTFSGLWTEGGDLDLSNNSLKLLPVTFHKLRIDGGLNLSNNELTELPKRICHLDINGSLNLSNNELTELPKTFIRSNIEGVLDLSNNKLKRIPDNFDGIHVTQGIILDNNGLDLEIDDFRWSTDEPLDSNNDVMDNFVDYYMEDHCGDDYKIIVDDGAYIKIKNDQGMVFGVDAGGDGDFNRHRVVFTNLLSNLIINR